MTDQLQPGEFVGQDGKVQRVEGIRCSHGVGTLVFTPDDPDFPAAAAAAVALAEEAQWVEIDARMRISKDGKRVQTRDGVPRVWEEYPANDSHNIFAVQGYRAALRAHGIGGEK